jgi:hypothetical protein
VYIIRELRLIKEKFEKSRKELKTMAAKLPQPGGIYYYII